MSEPITVYDCIVTVSNFVGYEYKRTRSNDAFWGCNRRQKKAVFNGGASSLFDRIVVDIRRENDEQIAVSVRVCGLRELRLYLGLHVHDEPKAFSVSLEVRTLERGIEVGRHQRISVVAEIDSGV